MTQFNSFLQKSYNKRDFKACEGRETAVYWGVNEDFETERNAEITLLDGFSLYCLDNISREAITRSCPTDNRAQLVKVGKHLLSL